MQDVNPYNPLDFYKLLQNLSNPGVKKTTSFKGSKPGGTYKPPQNFAASFGAIPGVAGGTVASHLPVPDLTPRDVPTTVGAEAGVNPNFTAPANLASPDVAHDFLAGQTEERAQRARQFEAQNRTNQGLLFGRHLGTGGYEGGNSAGPEGNPFTDGFFKKPEDRAGLQSLTPEAVGARASAGLGLPNTGLPNRSGGVVTDRETVVNPNVPTQNFDQAQMIAQLLGLPTPPPGARGGMTPHGPIQSRFRAPANF